jgi:hypothetical protein
MMVTHHDDLAASTRRERGGRVRGDDVISALLMIRAKFDENREQKNVV